mgnify:FL=1
MLDILYHDLKELNLKEDFVEYTAQEKGDGCGYDIKSVESDGVTPRYIEVKTTPGAKNQSLYFTDTEMDFSKENREHYYLYRVYNFKSENEPADLLIVKGGLDEIYATPKSYEAKMLYHQI